MPDPYGNPLPGDHFSGGANSFSNFGGVGGRGNYGAGGGNTWLRSAVGNTGNPNLNYESYLTGLGFDINDDKVGKYFSGIQEGYQEDVGMARAGFAQGMQGMKSQAQGQAMQLGGGQGLSSAYNPGFGKAQYGIQQGLQGIQQQYGQGMQSGLLGFTQQKLTDYQFGGDTWIKFGGQWISQDEYDWHMSQDRDF